MLLIFQELFLAGLFKIGLYIPPVHIFKSGCYHYYLYFISAAIVMKGKHRVKCMN